MRHTSPLTSGTADSCTHTPPWEYSSASTAFCADRSSWFLFDANFRQGKDVPPVGVRRRRTLQPTMRMTPCPPPWRTTMCCQDPTVRGMTMMHPRHCYWQGSLKNFAFGLMDSSLLSSLWSGGGGDMNRHVPRGDADGDRNRLGAVVLLLAKQRLGGQVQQYWQ